MEQDFWSENILNRLFDMAVKLENKFEGAHLISVGQSPAWLCAMASEIRTFQGHTADTTFLSFSGSFTKSGWTKDYVPQFTLKEGKPTPSNYKSYFNYLAAHKARPQDLIKRFEETGQKTVFIDYTRMWNGYTSFLHSWRLSAQDDDKSALNDRLAQAIDYHAITAHGSALDGIAAIQIEIEDEQFLPVPISYIDYTRFSVIKELSGNQGEEPSSYASARLVPCFDISARGQGQPIPLTNHKMLDIILEKVKNTAQRRLKY